MPIGRSRGSGSNPTRGRITPSASIRPDATAPLTNADQSIVLFRRTCGAGPPDSAQQIKSMIYLLQLRPQLSLLQPIRGRALVELRVPSARFFHRTVAGKGLHGASSNHRWPIDKRPAACAVPALRTLDLPFGSAGRWWN